MDFIRFNKAKSLERDLDSLDRLASITKSSICDFNEHQNEGNKSQIAYMALRDLLFSEENTLFKEDFSDFLLKEIEKYKLEFDRT